MPIAQPLAIALLGPEVERGAARAAALAALERAARAVARLDALATGDPLVGIWRRHEAVVGAVAAVRETGGEADAADVLRLWATGFGNPDGAAGNALARLERPVAARRLAKLAPAAVPAAARGGGTLLDVADRLAAAAAGASAAAPSLAVDRVAGTASIAVFAVGDGHDLGDVAELTPVVLRRAGLTQGIIPSLTGRPQALVANLPPLERLARWAEALAGQAAAAEARLLELRRYMGAVDERLAGVRRPQAIRRAVMTCLEDGASWAARLARRSNVDIANAWRALGQAKELGLLLPLPGQRRSRGDARVLVAPPVLRAAGLLGGAGFKVAARRKPAVPVRAADLATAIDDVDAAMAAADALLTRLTPTGV